MIARRPSIVIYTYRGDRQLLREICAGIEEEGVFYEVTEKDTGDVDRLAYEAAEDSVLGSGIGVSGADAALQMRRLPVGRNVQKFHQPTKEQCRELGSNSARIIKKEGLKGL